MGAAIRIEALDFPGTISRSVDSPWAMCSVTGTSAAAAPEFLEAAVVVETPVTQCGAGFNPPHTLDFGHFPVCEIQGGAASQAARGPWPRF